MGGFKDIATNQKLAAEANAPAATAEPQAAEIWTISLEKPHELTVESIIVPARKRAIDPVKLERLKNSIARMGLRTPISVRAQANENGEVELVAGLHRLEAFKALGLEYIPVRQEEGSDLDAELWEVSENLDRAELSALERGEHIRDWARLVEAKKRETEEAEAQAKLNLEAKGSTKPAQVGPVSGKAKGGRGKKGGQRQAARDLNLTRQDLQRAEKTGNLTEEAKAKAKELGLDNNHAALLKAAEFDSADAQIASLQAHADKPAAPPPAAPIDGAKDVWDSAPAMPAGTIEQEDQTVTAPAPSDAWERAIKAVEDGIEAAAAIDPLNDRHRPWDVSNYDKRVDVAIRCVDVLSVDIEDMWRAINGEPEEAEPAEDGEDPKVKAAIEAHRAALKRLSPGQKEEFWGALKMVKRKRPGSKAERWQEAVDELHDIQGECEAYSDVPDGLRDEERAERYELIAGIDLTEIDGAEF